MIEIGKPFKNIDVYNNAMLQSINDKLFFLDKLPKENYLFVDFGCADGSLISELQKLIPQSSFIGYDISEEMLKKARLKTPNIEYTNNWNNIVNKIEHSSKKKVLILSSVIHEIYSYAFSEQDIVSFWSKVKCTGFDYIVIRDMIPESTINRPSNSQDRIKVLKYANKNQLSEFESNFGSIKNNQNLIHFLLKYRYIVNWNREVNENYFPIYKEFLLDKFKSFEIVYLNSFRVQYLDDCIYKDFRIKLKDNTHLKAIFRKVNLAGAKASLEN